MVAEPLPPQAPLPTPLSDETARRDRAQRAAELKAAGFSVRKIADQLGVSRTTVSRDLATPQTRGRGARASKRSEHRPTPRHSKRAAVVSTDPNPIFPSPLTVIRPPDPATDAWHKLDLSTETFRNLTPAGMFDLLRAASPDVSRAVWDYLRLLDPGHEIVALRPGTEDPDTRAQAALDAFIGTLKDRYGSFKVITGRLFMSALTRGAFFAELVLDESGRVPLDLAVPDPMSVRFRRVADDDLGSRMEMVQWQQGKGYQSIERPTVRYIPVDPAPASPYGIAPIAPAVFPALFLIGLLGDIRRVIAQAGYPKTDITVKLDGVKAMLGGTPTAEKISEAIDQILDAVSSDYAAVEPDDAWVHTDATEVSQSNGAVSGDALRGVDSIIASLERMLVKALKTMPLMMGDTQGASEANANRQWEIYAAGIKSLQHLAESLLESLLTLALEAQGIRAKVQVRFSELRAAEELRDQLTLQAKVSNAENLERLGYIDHDEAAMLAIGHEATGTPTGEPGGGGGVNPNTPAGETPERTKRSTRDKIIPTDADVPLPPLPATVEVDEADADRAIATWDNAMGDEWRGLLNSEPYDPDADDDTEEED